MKTLRTFIVMLGVILSSTAFYSCLKDDGNSLNDANLGIVTIKPLSSDSYYLQLDDTTTLWPVNNYVPSNLKERRAIVYFQLLPEKMAGYTHSVNIIRMDSVLTKPIAENLGAKNDEVYGKDPVTMYQNSLWVKGGVWIEDGYLNINFISEFGGYKKHFLNLIPASENNQDPYSLEFRHNAYDDPKTTRQEGLVAFDLKTLPDTKGETVKLKIKYKSYDGDKTIELDYKSK